MHQQTTQTKRFENLLNWCQGQVRDMDFILEDAYLSDLDPPSPNSFCILS